jgi:hypothetical protein
MEGSEEGVGEFVVAGGEAAKLFELVEEAFDAVALAIACRIVREFFAARVEGRDDGFDPVHRQAFPDAIRVVAFVQNDRLEDIFCGQAFIERLELSAVMSVACAQVERDRAVFVDRRRVDFGGESAPRAAQSLITGVFFGAPAACGCARTVVESISRSRASAKGSVCKFCQSRRQTPRASQRRKRM